MPGTILVVEDDERLRATLLRVLSDGGRDVRVAESAEAALGQLPAVSPDLVLSDVRMSGMSGLELPRLLRERAPDVDVVLMTAYDDLPTVAGAMKDGAADFLVKPLDLHQLRNVVERVFQDRRARSPQRTAARAGRAADAAISRELIGRDEKMVEVFKLIGQLASSRASVVIRGESGTGKELIARAIHANSPAADEPFVAVNCTALPETLLESELFGHVKGAFTGATADRRGRFALAGRGTILLDEIGDTSLAFQSKLLRVLQEQEFYPVGSEHSQRAEARVLAATHRDLEAMVAAGSFREDLYYRLRVVEIRLPPLRERMSDIGPLAKHLIAKAARVVGRSAPVLSSESMSALLAHGWPGNVRELENCLVRATVLATGGLIRPQHLGLNGTDATTDGTGVPRLSSLDDVEKVHVARALEATGGNRTRAAELLGVSRPRLRRMIEKHGLE